MSVPHHPDCTLHHKADIVGIIERLRRERALTTVEFGDGHAIVSSILEVRHDVDVLIFDIARDPEQNRRLFASASLAFVSELDHIQIGFETGAPSLVTIVDGPAAVVDLPSSVVRLQRRGAFRAALPAQPPIRCLVRDDEGHALQAQAIDLSAGGAALFVDGGAIDLSKVGHDHALVMSLPEVGRLEIDATLRTVTRAVDATGHAIPKVRMGFRFEAMPAKTANEIQRYVQRLEVHQLRMSRARG